MRAAAGGQRFLISTIISKEISTFEKYSITTANMRLSALIRAYYCVSALGSSYKIVLDRVVVWHPFYLEGYEDI